jgi:hypothetical protein
LAAVNAESFSCKQLQVEDDYGSVTQERHGLPSSANICKKQEV